MNNEDKLHWQASKWPACPATQAERPADKLAAANITY